MKKIRLTQEPYYTYIGLTIPTGCDCPGARYEGPCFTASAEYMDCDDDDDLEVVWLCDEEWLESGDEDMSYACDWSSPWFVSGNSRHNILPDVVIFDCDGDEL